MSEKNLYKDQMHDLTSRAQQEHLKEFLGRLEANKEGRPYKAGWFSNTLFIIFMVTAFVAFISVGMFLGHLVESLF